MQKKCEVLRGKMQQMKKIFEKKFFDNKYNLIRVLIIFYRSVTGDARRTSRIK